MCDNYAKFSKVVMDESIAYDWLSFDNHFNCQLFFQLTAKFFYKICLCSEEMS